MATDNGRGPPRAGGGPEGLTTTRGLHVGCPRLICLPGAALEYAPACPHLPALTCLAMLSRLPDLTRMTALLCVLTNGSGSGVPC